jgi:DNA invertase Pin-like site-specific DNA recombinase
MGKKKEKRVNCFVYLATNADEQKVEMQEKKQLRYIREYAAAHNIRIVKVYHKDILSQNEVNRHFKTMLKKIANKEAEGLLLANIGTISVSLADAYHKVGLIIAAGGQMITVDEGKLSLNIKALGGLAI